MVLCAPHSQPLFALTRSGFIDRLGLENVCGDVDASLERAREILRHKRLGDNADAKTGGTAPAPDAAKEGGGPAV
jgi:hypothetical protein